MDFATSYLLRQTGDLCDLDNMDDTFGENQVRTLNYQQNASKTFPGKIRYIYLILKVQQRKIVYFFFHTHRDWKQLSILPRGRYVNELQMTVVWSLVNKP